MLLCERGWERGSARTRYYYFPGDLELRVWWNYVIATQKPAIFDMYYFAMAKLHHAERNNLFAAGVSLKWLHSFATAEFIWKKVIAVPGPHGATLQLT